MKKAIFTAFIINSILCAITVLCLSVTSDVSFYGMFGVFALFILFSLVLALFCYRKIRNDIGCFYAKTSKDLDTDEFINDLSFRSYTEFEPFLRLLNTQNKLIKEHIRKLKNERNTIKAITDNMKEGFILLNAAYEILTFNKSAVIFLNSQNVVFASDRLISLNENSLLYDSVKQALDGNANDFMVEISSKTFHIFSNPVLKDSNIHGVVVMCVDITQKSNVERANRDFTVNVSHELKTPLTSILGYAEMMSSGMVASSEDNQRFAQIIYKETSRLVKLTSDIVRLSEIESNMLPVNDEELNISELFDSTIETLTLTADNRNVTLKNSLTSPLMFTANRSLIEELIFNLCENAIKYNKDGGSVILSATESLNGVEISVSDTGIGIPEEQLENVFNRFWRVDKSRSKSTGGTGLGLSIVKQIAEYYSGTVKAASKLGEGTTITVNLYPQ